MSLDIIIGTQWGDEGKGRVVDLMASQADYAARFNGGDSRQVSPVFSIASITRAR